MPSECVWVSVSVWVYLLKLNTLAYAQTLKRQKFNSPAALQRTSQRVRVLSHRQLTSARDACSKWVSDALRPLQQAREKERVREREERGAGAKNLPKPTHKWHVTCSGYLTELGGCLGEGCFMADLAISGAWTCALRIRRVCHESLLHTQRAL